jgi:hypothetical protein
LYKVNDISIVQEVNSFFSGPDLAGWFPAVIMLVVLIFLGEIIALLGEALIHPLFGFPSFKPLNAKDFDIENVTPCAGSGKLTAATMNRAAREQGAFSFSEIHFVLSRILAGTAWLLGLVVLFLLFKGEGETRKVAVLPDHCLFLIFLFYLLIPSICVLKCVLNNFSKGDLSFLSTANFIFSVSAMVCLGFVDKAGLAFLFLVLILFLFINALLYRSFANVWNVAENAKNESGGNQP